MRIAIFLLTTLLSFDAYAQLNYDCHNQSEQTANWKFLGPVNNGEDLIHQRFGAVSCVSVNPQDSNEIYVGGRTGSLMHTVNRGNTWQSLTDEIDVPIVGVNDLLVDYSKKPHEIIIATGSHNKWYDTPNFGIFKSIDGGKNWVRKKTNPKNEVFEPAFDEIKKYGTELLSNSRNRIVYSPNKGDTWSILIHEKLIIDGAPLSKRYIRHFEYLPKEKKIYFSTKQKYVSGRNENARIFCYSLKDKSLKDLTPLLINSYKSEKKDNGGMEAIGIEPFGDGKFLFVASLVSSPEVFFYTYDYQKGEITDYEVPNAGRLPGASTFWFHGHEINKLNNRIRYQAGVYLYKSIDGGQTYKALFGYSLGHNNVPHVDIQTVLITKYSKDGESDHIYLGTDGGLSFSRDGGKTFRNLNGHELQLTQFYGLGSSPFNGIVSAGSQDNSIISYVPKEDKWIYDIRGDGYDVAYSKIKPGLAYGQYNSRRLYASLKDIVPFNKSMGIGRENANNRKTIYTHPNGDIFFAGQSLFHLPKNETKWAEYKTPLSHKAMAMGVSKQNNKLIYMSGLWQSLIKTEDGGITWTDITKNLIIDGRKITKRIQSICVSPYDQSRIWIGLGYQGAYDKLCKSTIRLIESKDGGKTWFNNSDGLPVFSIQDIQFLEGSYESLFAATQNGVYFKRGSGHKWQRFSQNLPKCLIAELNINYCRGKLLAATYGRGLWETNLPIIQDKNPMIIRGNKTFSAPKGEVLVVNQDIILKGRTKLTIDCPVYMPKGSKLTAKKKCKVLFTENGKLLNGCGNKWQGVIEK